MSHKSAIWNYFERTVGKDSAKCTRCNKSIKCKGSSTSSLRNHLKNVHGIEAKNKVDSSDEEGQPQLQPSSSKKIKISGPSSLIGSSSMLHYVKRESLGELLAKCAALDGISINTITKSTAIKEFVINHGYEMPKARATVKKNNFRILQTKTK